MEEALSPELWASAIAVLVALAGLAVVVTKMTKTPEDDKYAAAFLRAVQAFAGMFGAKPKQ